MKLKQVGVKKGQMNKKYYEKEEKMNVRSAPHLIKSVFVSYASTVRVNSF